MQAPTIEAPVHDTALALRDSAELQGNILAGFRKPYQDFVFLWFPDEEAGQRWCRDLLVLDGVGVSTTADVARFNQRFKEAQEQAGGGGPLPAAAWVNVGFTLAGLSVIAPQHVQAEQLALSFPAFCQGAAQRAAMLGDTGDSDPATWVVGKADEPVHAIITIAADLKEDLDQKRKALIETVSDNGLKIVGDEPGRALDGGIEHFGFNDGVSQPKVKGFDVADEQEPRPEAATMEAGKPEPHREAATPEADGQEPPALEAGEFVLGYPSEFRPSYPVARYTVEVPKWMHDGSFQVFRRLAQDVQGWRERVEDWHKQLNAPVNVTPEQLEAKLIGRWRDGTPLALAPDQSAHASFRGTNKNAFNFDKDPHGQHTPRYAHIRRMYPRDERLGGNRRRIIRRGITFGNELPEGEVAEEAAEEPRGLLFNAFMASIEGQFEYLQKSWANNPYFPGSVLPGGVRGGHVKEGVDPVVGSDPYVDQGAPAQPAAGASLHTPPNFQRFVRTTGAVYAFAPSISTIRQLAEGRLDPPQDQKGDGGLGSGSLA